MEFNDEMMSKRHRFTDGENNEVNRDRRPYRRHKDNDGERRERRSFRDERGERSGASESNENKINYIFGMHPVIEAVSVGKHIEKVFFKSGLEGDSFRDLITALQEKNIPFQFVPAPKLDKMVKGRHQGVVAQISTVDYSSLEEAVDYAMSKSGLVLILDGVSDVRNFGAIARSAECAGFKSLILLAKGGASITPDSIKTSAGALLRINVCKVPNIRTAIFYLKEKEFNIVAASEKGESLIYDVDFTKPTAVIVGDEHNGVSNSALELADNIAAIPMVGEIGSLNVSVASAIVMYEAVRQRNNIGGQNTATSLVYNVAAGE